MTATELFQLAVSCYLRELDDSEFDALTRRVRPPKPDHAGTRKTGRRKDVEVMR